MENPDFDKLTRTVTAFESFADMLNAAPSYRPTIRPRDLDHVDLADAYDAAQAARGDARRAHRGNFSLPEPDVSPEGFLTVSLGGVPAGSGLAGEWQRVIWTINGKRYNWLGGKDAAPVLGAPVDSHYGTDGAWIEEYPDFRVILRHTRPGRGESGFSHNYGVIQAKGPAASALLFAAVNEVRGDLAENATRSERAGLDSNCVRP